MALKGGETDKKMRKSLLQLQAETKVRDPSAHAKLQMAELDKSAKKSALKRKQCDDQIEADTKEIHHLEEQMSRINVRYLPTCEALKEMEDRRAGLEKLLEDCVKEEKQIMSNTKNTVHERMIDDAKLNRKMATEKLEILRGFTIDPSSTFSQTGGAKSKSSTLPPLKSTGK